MSDERAYDTPFINRNDVRMTPNTFEAIVLQGRRMGDECTMRREHASPRAMSQAGKASLDANRGQTESAPMARL